MHIGRRCLVSMVIVLVVSSSAWAAPRLQVAATIFPLYDLVRQVAGEHAKVVLLVPPGASPHTVNCPIRTVSIFDAHEGNDMGSARMYTPQLPCGQRWPQRWEQPGWQANLEA